MPNNTLKIKQNQQLALTPQLQQSINILGMNHHELSVEIQNMLSQNFMLSTDKEDFSEITTDGTYNEDQSLDYDEHELWSDRDADWPSEKKRAQDGDSIYCATVDLATYLSQQILLMSLDPDTTNAALILAYSLDERGYLKLDEKTALSDYAIHAETYHAAVFALQQCLPTGIGARHLEEALNLQIDALPVDTPYLKVLKRIMRRHFIFLDKDPDLIKKQLQFDDDQFEGALALLRTLQPNPADNYTSVIQGYIEPEIIVRERGGISYIAQFDTHLPQLEINQTYASVTPENAQQKTLLNAQINEARWFINALAQRASTVRRVANIIVATQQDFFQQGDIAMRPLTRKEVAEMLEIHESTVARAVNGKYLACKRGVYELRRFFSQAVTNINDADEPASVTAVKARISELIEYEDKVKPLTDQKICALLNKEGHQLARRTVTKYRENLGLVSASKRRERRS